jgi:hypothetical protein
MTGKLMQLAKLRGRVVWLVRRIAGKQQSFEADRAKLWVP